MYGYNNIPVTTSESREQGYRTVTQESKMRTKDILVAGGLDEIKTFSLMDKEIYDELQMTDDEGLKDWVNIKNPLSQAFAVMRTTLIPGTVKVLSNNKRRQLNKMAVFEIGRVYKSKGKNKRPYEEEMIAGGSMGSDIKSWNNKAPDFFYLKGVLNELFDRLNIDVKYKNSEIEYLHPGRTATIESNGEKIGFIGELLYETIDEFDLMEGTTVFQISFDKLMQKMDSTISNYKELPKFPAVNRDLAFVVNRDIAVSTIRDIIENAGGELLEDIELFDLYEGEQIPDEKKSLAFNLIFRSNQRTLTDDDVNEVFNKILNSLKDKIGVEIRGN